MAIYPGTERVLSAAAQWRERGLLGGESVFSPTDAELWSAAHLDELKRDFVERPDVGTATFMDRFQAQLAPASPGARRLAAEMIWVMMLFPNNITGGHKLNLVADVWGWSGSTFPRDHPLAAEVLRRGIGSAGQAYNNYRYAELTFFVLLMRDWRARPRAEQEQLLGDPWRFGAWMDTIPGAQNRQLRHMLLHLLFPEHYERVASNAHKRRIDAAFRPLLAGADVPPEAAANTLVAQDRRIHLERRLLEREHPGKRLDFYESPLWERWAEPEPGSEAEPPAGDDPPPPEPTPPPEDYAEPPFGDIVRGVRERRLRLDERTLRRYHLALKTRGFVILAGVSGTGKTWLAQAYAEAAGAACEVMAVAPNWTTNEDLLGYLSPMSGTYQDTPASRFLRAAATAHDRAREAGVRPRPYHLVLDEMNLARVEHYFARFLSAMEVRARGGDAVLELSADDAVALPPNLFVVGTVNVDETTHGFADKVYDRAQVIEVEAPRAALAEHLEGAPWAAPVLEVWDALAEVAPFAFRVLDEIAAYALHADGLDVGWETLLDEQLLQKVLPRVRGHDPRLGEALDRLAEITDGRFPLTHARVLRIRDGFVKHGFASFH